MRRIAALTCLVSLALAACQAPPPQTASPGPPPLVDRNVFFGDPEIAFAALSPEGERVAFARDYEGILNVWVKEIGQPWEEARPVTADRKRPIFNFFWSEDGRYLLFTQDQAGNENFRVYAVDPADAADPETGVPPARDLTPYEEIQARIYSVPENTPDRILVGINDRDARVHDVYGLTLSTGERERVFENTQNVAGWMADLDGNLRLGFRVNEEGGNEVLRVDGSALEKVYECTYEETCQPIRFHKDGKRVYMVTDVGDDVDKSRLVLFDPAKGEVELVESDPEGEVDFGGAIFSRATDELIATSYTGARTRIYPRDPRFERDMEAIRRALPDGDLFFRVPSRDDNVWIVKNVLDTDEGPNYIYDRRTGEVELLYRPMTVIPVEHMAPMRAVSYTARDGLEIPAYLTLPLGVEAENLPVVINPHGGPWGRDTWGFSALAQFLANRGYAVLQPNFRGSTGYGKRFLNLGNREWGTGAMQHDITDGVRWLIDEGIADPKRVAIMGTSYGGYATLAGVTFTPELYAAGVDIVGPSSIVTLIRSIPPYWEPIKEMFAKRVGDIDDPDDLAMLEKQSPLYSASEIRAPLLIIQGANDPRVKQAESDQIVVALRDLGRTVEYLVATDEGHGFAGEENTIAMWAATERFLAAHLGGRYQEEMPPEIAAKLEELTVDVSTVTLPEEEAETGP